MPLWSKISNAKLAAGALITIAALAGLGGVIFWVYTKYQFDSHQEIERKQIEMPLFEKSKQPTIQDQINKLKQQIDIKNPSLEDIKQILTMISNYVKNKTLSHSSQFKKNRRIEFPHGSRISNIGEYLKFSSQGLMQLQQTIIDLQNQQSKLFSVLGVSQETMEKYAEELGPFMQELIYDSSITLSEVKRSITVKTQYLSDHGQMIVRALIQLSSSLSLQEKQFIPLLLNIIISDEAFENDPQLDRDQFDMAYQKFQEEAKGELVKLQRVIIPLMGKLQAALIGDEMGGLGGFGGPKSYLSQNSHLEDELSGSAEGNQQLIRNQLQMMRQNDPEGYTQMMAMMQAQNH